MVLVTIIATIIIVVTNVIVVTNTIVVTNVIVVTIIMVVTDILVTNVEKPAIQNIKIKTKMINIESISDRYQWF